MQYIAQKGRELGIQDQLAQIGEAVLSMQVARDSGSKPKVTLNSAALLRGLDRQR